MRKYKCDYPPCRNTAKHQVKNTHGETKGLCDEHTHTALKGNGEYVGAIE